MKKIITAGVFVFVFAMTANLASARWDRDCCHDNDNDDCCPTLTVSNESHADIDNRVLTVSNTGMNITGNTQVLNRSRFGDHHSNTNFSAINTDTAEALADVQTGANDTNINVTTPQQGAVNVSNDNNANVHNMVVTMSNTGLNKNSSGRITSGAAYAGSSVMTVVNASVIRIK
jgi:hypothetical protein